MLPREFTMHMTPLSYKLGSLKVQSFYFPFCSGGAINVASWYLTFLPGADIWLRSHYRQPCLLLRQTIPIDRYGPCEAFYLGLIQDLTWPLNLRSTAVKCLPCHSLWRHTDSSWGTTHTYTQWPWSRARTHTYAHTLTHTHTHTHTQTFTTFVAYNWDTHTPHISNSRLHILVSMIHMEKYE